IRMSRFDEVQAVCDVGLAVLQGGQGPVYLRERAALQQRRAAADGERGVYTKAIAELNNCLPIAEKAGDIMLRSIILNNLGLYLGNIGHFDRALECHADSLRLKMQMGDAAGQVHSLINMGIVYQMRGDDGDALAAFEQARELCRRHAMSEEHLAHIL